MLLDFIYVFYSALPGIVGALLSALFSIRFVSAAGGPTLLAAGFGGFFAYLLLAALLYAGNLLGVTVFRPGYLTALAAVFTLSLLAVMRLAHFRPRFRVGYSLILTLPIFLIVGISLYHVALAPISSWDSLTMWVSHAHEYLQFDESRSSGEAFESAHPRHPLTVVTIAAFSGHAASQGIAQLGPLSAWWFVWVSGAMALTGAVLTISRSYWLAGLAAYAYFSVPLLENHASLVGYADLWVTVNVTVVVALLTVGLSRAGVGYLALGVLLAFAPLAFKNTGILYSASLLLPLLVVLLRARFPRLLAIILVLGALLGLWAVLQGFDFNVAGRRYALDWTDSGQIAFGGYIMSFKPFSFDRILHNHLWAFFVNQSFSTVVGLGLCSAVWLFARRGELELNVSMPLQFLLGAAITLTTVFMLPQLVTSYAERFAVPPSDIGMSRFLLGVPPILLITLAFWPHMINRPREANLIKPAL